MTKKCINVCVTTYNAKIEFVIQLSITGRQLFEQVAKTIGLREVWFFGLEYIDNNGFPEWLRLNKKIKAQNIKKEFTLNFNLKAKFFPEDIDGELIQDDTIKFFYCQVKEEILNGDIYCSPESSVLLASYMLQAQYGNFSGINDNSNVLANQNLLPQCVLSQFKLNTDDWIKYIKNLWIDHYGMSKIKAMKEYLKLAQDLEMYGVNYFEIKNKKGSELYLGVDCRGLNIYKESDMLSPCIGFTWSEIKNISFNDKKFIIKPIDKKATDLIFYVSRIKINKKILSLCMGNHELYIRRRKSDTIEIQQMKSQAIYKKKLRMLGYNKLSKETAARVYAEQKQREAKNKIKIMTNIVNKTKEELNIMYEKYRQLQIKYDELNKTKELLTRNKNEVEKLNEQLLAQKQANEKDKKMALREGHLQVKKINKKVKTKLSDTHSYNKDFDVIDEITMDSEPIFNEIDEESYSKDIELITKASVNIFYNINKLDSEISSSVNKKLALLTQALEPFKDKANMSKFDLLHEVNKKEGKNKYRTLRQIRIGNTKRRIDQYENM
ncbi:Moesin/ezrin/radixin homolog 1 [Strongyloides ratti]|uniref:Moesin/ezrin/radixin homolog 1 n=1 Tax=Strongyloides ratti TaxID=34506 RepID=A0A090L2N1_STRRB|nr:Moesin/ezrin/radixin homolog 1 [Strongyloides ratti]CEF63967.1 Moesin/ezrin/radixin homolog 1 [Strongyloides ratti]